METFVWDVRILGTPAVNRKCGKCGCGRFVSSGRFRVNANGSRIDVWLIFKCEHCNATWNMEILSRVKADSISRELYSRFLDNDEALALQYALDGEALCRSGAAADADALTLEIYGELPAGGDAQVIIKPVVALPVSVVRVIAQRLGISLSAVRRIEDAGLLEYTGSIRKAKLNADAVFTLRAGWDSER
ncbi:MAG: DUF1062 domain-containing protein [Bacillota bacterium]